MERLMQPPTAMKHWHVDAAESLGKVWAEKRVDRLMDVVPAIHWPDQWRPEDDEPLPFGPEEVGTREREILRRIAEHAAAERWRELLTRHRFDEDAEDEDQDLLVFANRLLEMIQPGLPEGLIARQAGERVVLEETATGREHTVTSLPNAWRVVAEWLERTSPS